jgi:hypothetical protein
MCGAHDLNIHAVPIPPLAHRYTARSLTARISVVCADYWLGMLSHARRAGAFGAPRWGPVWKRNGSSRGTYSRAACRESLEVGKCIGRGDQGNVVEIGLDMNR